MQVVNEKWYEKVGRNVKQVVEKAKQVAHETIEYVEEHKEVLVLAAPFVLAACHSVGKGIHTLNKNRQLQKAKELKDLYVYDHSSGLYVRLKQKMNKIDISNFNQLKRNGMKTTEALEYLDLVD